MSHSIAPDATIMGNVSLGSNVTIGKGALIYPNVILGDHVFIGAYCIIGEPKMDYYKDPGNYQFETTKIGAESIIRSHTVIYEEVMIGELFQTGHHVTIREQTRIGDNCSIGTLSDIQSEVEIGNHVRLHSNVFVCSFTRIDDYAWIFPSVTMTNDPYPPRGIWVGSHIKEYAVVATGTIILPGKSIGKNSLVGAGSVVTKDVPEEVLVTGVPAKARGSVRDIQDEEGNHVYPWQDHMKQHRGYPWQQEVHSKKMKP